MSKASQDLETVATIHILRAKGGQYGADMTVYGNGMDIGDIPAEHDTLVGLCGVVATFVAAVLRRRGQKDKREPYTSV